MILVGACQQGGVGGCQGCEPSLEIELGVWTWRSPGCVPGAESEGDEGSCDLRSKGVVSEVGRVPARESGWVVRRRKVGALAPNYSPDLGPPFRSSTGISHACPGGARTHIVLSGLVPWSVARGRRSPWRLGVNGNEKPRPRPQEGKGQGVLSPDLSLEKKKKVEKGCGIASFDSSSISSRTPSLRHEHRLLNHPAGTMMKRPTPYRKDEIRKSLEAHDEAGSDEFWSKARGWDVSQSSSDALKKRLQRDRASVNLPDMLEKPKKKS
eukprot:gene1046-biopygen1151